MARTPMVTRNIKTTHLSVMCVNTERAEIENVDITLPRTYKSKKEMAKAIDKANLIPEPYKMVEIVDSFVEENIYGMTEQEFISNAKIVKR